jgi:hypothetical protein
MMLLPARRRRAGASAGDGRSLPRVIVPRAASTLHKIRLTRDDCKGDRPTEARRVSASERRDALSM